MTYADAKSKLETLQSAQQSASQAASTLQPLIDAAQAEVSAFHVWQIDLTPGGSDAYSNPQFPPDAVQQGNANITQVIRDSEPDPITVDHAVYDTSALTWGDPVSETKQWADMGPAT